MAHDTGDSDWRPVFNAFTSRSELDRIINRETRRALLDVLAQLDAMPNLTPDDKQRAWEVVAPQIETGTRAAMLAGWARLQLEASLDTGVIH